MRGQFSRVVCVGKRAPNQQRYLSAILLSVGTGDRLDADKSSRNLTLSYNFQKYARQYRYLKERRK